MPAKNEISLDGHALLPVEYNAPAQHFIVRNSQGKEFGDQGYCYIPYDFFIGKYNTNQINKAKEAQDNTFSFWCLTHD
ncbi:hypothetical protein A3Q34_13200 [Colwellia sp. PAMC 20917]|uniref:hypothetical protein n=1 Tax=Colwellia sp. PAMC 20917 TaxID=1816218 RepID=UPI000878A3A9|nr:hypothetical protein [Colwellia sp. PAMC 20917]AOW77721.1 hypothetical protein A3Q34_13200 [Colwellia sp. PAMC 20917]